MPVSALTPYAQAAIPLAQRSIAFGSISGSYTLIGSIFSAGLIELIIVSTLDGSVQLSLDGVTDWLVFPAGAVFIDDLKSNSTALPGWRGVYVKTLGSITMGSLYVSGFTV